MPAKLIKCVNSQSSSGKQKKSILMGFLLDIWLWSLYGTTKDKYMDIQSIYNWANWGIIPLIIVKIRLVGIRVYCP